MKKVIAYVCSLFFAFAYAHAQNNIADSANRISEIVVSANRAVNFSSGTKMEQVDSLVMTAYRYQSVVSLLQSQNQIFIKSYGPPNISSSSFRGAGAEHTAVLWNGFNLQSPLTGQMDLSLIQNDFIDELKVQYGSSGALYGSGAVGGVIHLNNKPQYGSGWHASVNMLAGSMENYKEGIGISYGAKKFYSSIRFTNQHDLNKFYYTNPFLPSGINEVQNSAKFTQRAILSDNYFLLSKSQELNVKVWYQDAARQIPPSMSVPQSTANQYDGLLRISGEWNIKKNKSVCSFRSAWLDEALSYKDSSYGIQSSNRAKTNITEVEVKSDLAAGHFLNVGMNNTYTMASVDGFGKEVNQNRTSVFGSYKYVYRKKFQTCISLREELFEKELLPLMPSFGFEWKVNQKLRLYGNVSRFYRVPTLNERYWNPGGNLNLKPEQGFGEELSLNINHALSIINLSLTSTVFNRFINDWIQWVPSGSYWSAKNIRQVWSRGAELHLKGAMPIGKCNFIYEGRVNYILSTTERSDIANDLSVSKQLIYVPKLNYMNQLITSYKSNYVIISQTYNGIRYTQSDQSDWLLYYVIFNVSAGKEFSFKKFKTALAIQANNIFDEGYEVVQYRPMPGRNYSISLTFKI